MTEEEASIAFVRDLLKTHGVTPERMLEVVDGLIKSNTPEKAPKE